jgi:hypothetical protein
LLGNYALLLTDNSEKLLGKIDVFYDSIQEQQKNQSLSDGLYNIAIIITLMVVNARPALSGKPPI